MSTAAVRPQLSHQKRSVHKVAGIVAQGGRLEIELSLHETHLLQRSFREGDLISGDKSLATVGSSLL